MTVALQKRSLRNRMLVSAIAFGAIATASMLVFISFTKSVRQDLTAGTAQLRVEQRIADQIVSSAYGQQLAAFRHLQRPSAATLEEFRDHGLRVYQEISRYLFLDMPLQSRLKVETIKEAHQDFEVAAQNAFDLALGGAPALARARADGLSRHTTVLERAVRAFVEERVGQREVLRAQLESRLMRLQTATALTALAIVVLAIGLADLLRRRVMLPLRDLSDAVRLLQDGSVAVRVAPQRYQEFQLLADSFDRMAARIRDSQLELESRNVELTGTLEHLRRAQQDLVQHEKLSAVGEMLAGLAHELNNPLAGVLGLGEVLQAELAESTDPKVRALGRSVVTPLVSEAIRARHLVHNLLHFARQSTPRLEPVRLAESVGVAVGLRQHMFAQEQKTIDIDVPSDVKVVAQAQKLEHAIINLVNNALDALREGGGSVLRIRAAREGDSVLLFFEDDGPGFLEPERAFDPFYTTKPVGSGTGLGLTLVHRFAEAFGGAVTAENCATGGARVTLRLRASADEPASTAKVVESPPILADLTARSLRRRVLVVDDEPALREVQRRLLLRLGIDVVTAASGADACAAIRATKFDLVITDLRMPGDVSGHDLLEWLGREYPALGKGALVVTGDVAGDALSRLPFLRPEQILTKPFDRQEYEARVWRALAFPQERALAS